MRRIIPFTFSQQGTVAIKREREKHSLTKVDISVKDFLDFERHCVKSVLIRSFLGRYFPAFGPNTERYSVSLFIWFGCGKMRTRKTPNTDTFHAVRFRDIFRTLWNIYGEAILQKKNTYTINTTNQNYLNLKLYIKCIFIF